MEYMEFKVLEIDLEGKNLVEASAGTGKTYSIAILALRLILEKDIPVNKILMVTFTKAAVAELEERIRLFVRKAYQASTGHSIDDATIKKIVDDTIARSGNQQEVQRKLKDAILLLDETSVLTIHSFCQQTLNQYAFETNQIFGSEILQDTKSLITELVNEFWRNYITILPVPIIDELLSIGFSRKQLTSIINEHLSGKKYLLYDKNVDYLDSYSNFYYPLSELEDIKKRVINILRELNTYVQENRSYLESQCEKNHNARPLSQLLVNPDDFISVVKEKVDKNYIQKLFSEVVMLLNQETNAIGEIEQLLQGSYDMLTGAAIDFVSQNYERYKQRKSMLTFDDMIQKLHNALFLNESAPRAINLKNRLNEKYSAVFIDEFQDTDKLQYDIFNAVFSEKSILFYIGDPKQSIYAWRKADIYTYFRAKQSCKVYTMNHNFRSSEPNINAMNHFFDINDPFYFANVQEYQDAITYIPVQSPTPNSKGSLIYNDQNVRPIKIVNCQNKGVIASEVAMHIQDLLGGGYLIKKNGETRAVKASDIGIVVRTKSEAKDVKRDLTKCGIASVTVSDEKILASDEALYLWYLLLAIEAPTKSNINRALYTPFTGWHKDEILKLDDEKVLFLFKKWKGLCEEKSVHVALSEFVNDLGVRGILLSKNTENGEKIITNLFHLIEILHKVQQKRNLSVLELADWLKKGIDGMEVEGDEYEQRMESDEDAVKIVTIHKSKGLEYNIVFAPFLNLKSDVGKFSFVSFRCPTKGDYLSVPSDRLTDEQRQLVELQNEQENRRLVYVAMTRSVYCTYIFNNIRGEATTTLYNFLNGLIQREQNIEIADYQDDEILFNIAPRNTTIEQPFVTVCENFSMNQTNWQRASYSSMALKAENVRSKEVFGSGNEYDRFVFSELKKGKEIGNMLHFILERINFSDGGKWDKVVTEALEKYAFDKKEAWYSSVCQMIHEVLNAQIEIDGSTFRLSELQNNKRLHEMEFDFTVPLFEPQMLNELTDDRISVRIKSSENLEGLINGKLDMFFEHGGKYYILDWKSNFLGLTLDDYNSDNLLVAMNDNNYHLQYLLYTCAIDKYLNARLKNDYDYDTHFGGVIYCFLRGMRQSSTNAIYTFKPPLNLLNKMRSIMRLE